MEQVWNAALSGTYGATGALIGGVTGATIGGVVGSVFPIPPLGIVVGAFIGGIAGAVVVGATCTGGDMQFHVSYIPYKLSLICELLYHIIPFWYFCLEYTSWFLYILVS